MKRLLSLALVSVLSGSASGDVKVFTTNSCSGVLPAAGAVAVTHVGGKYRVEFSSDATGNYFLCSDPGDVVEWIRCDPAAFNVNLSTVTNRPISILEEISTTGTSFFGFRLGDIRIGERLGPSAVTTQPLVRVNGITSLEGPTAALTCPIEMRSFSGAPGNILFPQATLRTDIRNAFDGFNTLEFKSIEGTPADPVDIVTKGSLGILNVGTFDANGNGVGGDAVFVNIGDPALPLASRTMIARDLTFANDFSGHIALKSLRIPVIFGNAREWGILRCGRDFEGVPGATTFCFGKWCSCIMAGSAHDFAAGGKVVA